MSRYKKLDFAVYGAGQGHPLHVEGGYNVASNVQFDDNFYPKLSPGFVSRTITCTDDNNSRGMVTDGETAYTIIYNGSTNFTELWVTTDGLTWTKRFTFSSVVSGIAIAFYYLNNTLLVLIESHLCVSYDRGFSFSYFEDAVSHLIDNDLGLAYMGGYYYSAIVYGGTWGIQRTRDFVNWENFYNFDSPVDDYPYLIPANGILYVYYAGQIGMIIGGEFVTFSNVQASSFISDASFGIIFSQSVLGLTRFYVVEGGAPRLARIFSGIFDPVPFAIYRGFVYFYDLANGRVYRADTEGNYYYVETLPASYMSASVCFNDIRLYRLPHSGTFVTIYRTSDFVSSGTLDSGVMSLGEFVPKQLILRHKPLPAGTSVKVYADFDKSGSWGSAIITSATTGALKEKYTFTNSAVRDFFAFRVELLTSAPTVSPSEIELTFLYQPLGLENSQ
jgi:hypothetical protein